MNLLLKLAAKDREIERLRESNKDLVQKLAVARMKIKRQREKIAALPR